jgi:hypothetical protein
MNTARNSARDSRHRASISTKATSRRTLKIERIGDPWHGQIFSGIRLKGYWLSQAGFKAGERVSVHIVSPGVMELRLLAQAETSERRDARVQVQESIDRAKASSPVSLTNPS